MSNETVSLEKLKLIMQILATIAVPTIVAIVGSNVQESLSNKEVNKSYVLMALEILKSPPAQGDKNLREWAVAILDKNSPVPFAPKLKEQLAGSIKEGALQGVKLAPASEADMAGIIRYVECRKAKDRATVDFLLENYGNQFFKCEQEDEVGVFKYTTKRLLEAEKDKATGKP